MNAPILLFVFNRPDHVRRTVEALKQNTLSSDSVLYIYSDAARTPEQEGAVEEVRKYIHSVSGFKLGTCPKYNRRCNHKSQRIWKSYRIGRRPDYRTILSAIHERCPGDI